MVECGTALMCLIFFLQRLLQGETKIESFAWRYWNTPTQALELVPTMPLDDGVQRTLRATIRRWAKVLRDGGHDIPQE